MRALFCICLAVSAITIAAAGPASAQTAYDGTYVGGSGTLTGSMGGRATGCPPTTALAPLVISGGRAQSQWSKQPMEGTVSAQGLVIMHSAATGKLTAQIDGQGGVTGSYSGGCYYNVSWHKR
jgi:hypothetical protein